MIKEAINKISSGEELTLVEIREVFDEIIQGLADSTLTSSFVTALHQKKISIDEYLGSIISTKEAISKIKLNNDTENVIENISLGNIETFFDINLAVDLVCSSANLGALRYSFQSSEFENNSFKNLIALGINPCSDIENFIDNFEKTNFGYVYLPIKQPYFKYCCEISRKLPFDSIFSTLDKTLNPYMAKNQLIGVTSKELVEKFANICLGLNNSNSIVLCANNSLPFVSTEGETCVAEAWKNKIFTYILTPELLGFKSHALDEIKIENKEHFADLLIEVFKNKTKGAIYDFIVMNSCLSLYISKKANSLIEAIELAQKTIDNGLVYEKIEEIRKINKI